MVILPLQFVETLLSVDYTAIPRCVARAVNTSHGPRSTAPCIVDFVKVQSDLYVNISNCCCRCVIHEFQITSNEISIKHQINSGMISKLYLGLNCKNTKP
jgi:hypothetical protein